MRFGALVVAGLAAVASAAVSPQQVADTFKTLAQHSQDHQSEAQSINHVNSALAVDNQGPLSVRPPFIPLFPIANLLTGSHFRA